jgi:ABC-type histidine transport system ATPase subunit
MKVTLYKPPHGRQEVIDITRVRPEDEAYFVTQQVEISMEVIGGEFVIYAHIGEYDEDGEPDELIELGQGRTCEDTLSALRIACEAAKATP